MFGDIVNYFRSYLLYQQYKHSQIASSGEMLVTIPQEPWGTVCADFWYSLTVARNYD